MTMDTETAEINAKALTNAWVAVLRLGDAEAMILYRRNPAAFWRHVALLTMDEAVRIEASPPQ